MAERPLGVTILGILWLLGGLFWITGGFIAGGILNLAGLGTLAATFGVILLVIGIIDLLLGIGCFMAWSWVWVVGIIAVIINILVCLVSLFTGGSGAIIGLIIAVIIGWYVYQPKVKAYFGVT